MKKIILITALAVLLFGSSWSSVSGLDINEHMETSCKAKLEANDRIRFYANIYEVLLDKENLGLYDIKKYDSTLKKYILVSKEELENAKKELPNYLETQKRVNKKRYYPMGKKIYKKKCQKLDIDVEDYINIADLKEELQSTCNITDKIHLQAVSLYMWDVLREGGVIAKEARIHVTHDEKCPVCGMYVYKYPKWAAQIYYHDKHYSFDGVKDMMKWYFEHKEGIDKIMVSDYYSMLAVDGKKTYYVIGSDTYGPMGHELIPFESLSDAQNFLKDHRGKRVLKFEDITKEMVYALDNGEFL